MRKFGALLFVLCLFLAAGDTAFSMDSIYDQEEDQDTENYNDPSLVVNRPVNIQGLTGLIITNSAYTQPAGRLAVGLSAVGENSNKPDYSAAQGIFTATYGVTDRIEVGIKAKGLATNLGSTKTRESGIGDTDLLFKWRLSSQGETLPAFAIGLAYTIPTGDASKGLSDVKHEGIKLMLIGSAETKMSDGFVIGMYLEGQIVWNDQISRDSDNPYADKYGVLNFGLLVPVTESRQLQAILEVNYITKKDHPTLFDMNGTAVTPGLRYVTPRWNVTAGVQFQNRELQGATIDERYIGTVSYLF